MRLHGVLKKIVWDKNVKFTSNFWKELFVALGKELALSTSYHLQTNGQTKRIKRTLEDMLTMCVMRQ